MISSFSVIGRSIKIETASFANEKSILLGLDSSIANVKCNGLLSALTSKNKPSRMNRQGLHLSSKGYNN